MVKFMKIIRYDNISTITGQYNVMQEKSVYEVEYPDETTDQLTANIKTENMLSQVDSEGQHYQFLTKVTYHMIYYSTITKVGGFIKYSNGNLTLKSKTCGWKLLVEWKYVSFDWSPLKDLKYSNSVELDRYAVANEIGDEPAFRW